MSAREADNTNGTRHERKKGIDIMTYADALNVVLTVLTADAEYQNPNWVEGAQTIRKMFPGQEVIDKITALRDQQIKRNTAERKPTKTQVANVALAERVVEVLRNTDEKLTITQIMDADPVLGELNNQKVTALVRGLGDRVVKTIEKRKSYFQLA